MHSTTRAAKTSTCCTDRRLTEPTPKVSVITGVFNSRRYLASYFRMLSAQTFTDWEVILVDDGSTDDTVAFLRAHAATDARVRVFEKPPEGYPSRTRALALSHARGELVAFVDHDDLWAPQKLAIQVAAMARFPDTALLHTDRIVWTSLDFPDPIFHYGGHPDAAPVRLQSPEECIYGGLQIIFSSFMAKRAVVDPVGFNPAMRAVDDLYLFVRLAHLGAIRRVELPLTYYYAHSGNLSHTSNIFVAGFKQVADVLAHDPVSETARRALRAQALRTEAVSLLATNRVRALRLLVQSLRLYFIPSTLNRLAFLIATFFVPPRLQQSLLKAVKRIKFVFPTLRDLFS